MLPMTTHGVRSSLPTSPAGVGELNPLEVLPTRPTIKLMSYNVHRFDINMETDSDKLEAFLNGLDGEVVSIIPNIRKTTLAQIFGATRKVDFVLVVERT